MPCRVTSKGEIFMLLEDGDFLSLVDHLWICEIVEWSPLCNERCSWNQQMVIEHLKLEFVLSKSLSLSVTRSSIVSGAAMLMIWREKKRFQRRSLWFNKSSPTNQFGWLRYFLISSQRDLQEIPCRGECHRPFSRTYRSRRATRGVCDLHPDEFGDLSSQWGK